MAEWVGKARTKRCELNILCRADGSARLQQGGTSVLAAVHGPVEVRQNKEKYDKAVVEVIIKPSSGVPGVRERALEEEVRASCEQLVTTSLHPHSMVQIVLQVERNDGSLLSCLWNASCLALMDAGVGLKGTCAAVTVAWSRAGTALLDPSLEQERSCAGLAHLSLNGATQEVVTAYTAGTLTLQQLQQSLTVAKSACFSWTQFYRLCVERKLSKESSGVVSSRKTDKEETDHPV